MFNLKYKTIAVDFDNTLAETTDNSYPYIKRIYKDAIDALLEYQEKGGKVILFTCRTNEHLQIAINSCAKLGLVFDAINEDTEENKQRWLDKYPNSSFSPKVWADMYIDDRAYPLCENKLDWKRIRKKILQKA